MKWFSGPVQDAIAAAKLEQKIFLVFVEGPDETSKGMASKITDKSISEPIDENCVSIKLSTGSEPFRQFSQIYPVIVVPSLFFIGNNGIPLEVIAGSENQEDLKVKVLKAVELHKSKLTVSTASSSNSGDTKTGNPAPGSCSLEDPGPPAESMASTTVAEGAEASVDEQSEQARAEELLKQKMERAEQLIAERRRLRQEEEKEAEKQRELEQRRVSREIQKAREQMKEKEMADWAKQRQKEKQEDRAARERILAQIAQDKADRAAKFQYSGSSPPPSNTDSAPTTGTSSSVRQRSPQESASNSSQVARIQFRLPNSATASHEFPASATLQDVIRHVDQVVRPEMSNFSLATSFPRRHFSRADFSRTLRELELVPSSVLLVLPASSANAIAPSRGGGFWAMVLTLLTPFTLVWSYLSSVLFGSGSQRGEAAPTTAPSQSEPQQNPEPSGSTSGNRPRANENTNRYRRDGNIHRLSNESSNDDEDGTWNGNSTQQM